MKEHGHMLNMTVFHCPTTKTLCLASFFICVFNRSGFSAYTVYGCHNSCLPGYPWNRIPYALQTRLDLYNSELALASSPVLF